MMIKEWLSQIPIFFKWYFSLDQLKRIQLNYIFIIAMLILTIYFNDSKHRENYSKLSDRFDSVSNNRYKEQEKYTTKLEFYTDKFNNLLEKLIEQKQKIEEIKTENK
jgi:hypothetical protein